MARAGVVKQHLALLGRHQLEQRARLRVVVVGATSPSVTIMSLRIFLFSVARCLPKHSAGCSAQARIGAVAVIHRFGSSLNEHVHSHWCVIDAVFEPAAEMDDTNDAAGVVFHEAAWLDVDAIAELQGSISAW